MYDTSSKTSFENAMKTIIELQNINIQLLLFGDINCNREISYDIAKRLANQNSCIYLEANVIDTNSVETAFTQLALECMKLSESNVNDNYELTRDKRGCEIM
jgi:hypothetical protein